MGTQGPGERQLHLGLDAVICAVSDETPRVLTIHRDEGKPLLPHGPLNIDQHVTLERGLRDWVQRRSGIKLGYVEQLYTFGDLERGFTESESVRAVSVAYLALVHGEAEIDLRAAQWSDWYDFLPWEDWRDGSPEVLDGLLDDLRAWAGDEPRARERLSLCFGTDGATWDAERSLERYELLFEAGLVGEAGCRNDPRAMGRDHRRILATALGRVRGKIRYRPVVFELLPPAFTLFRLQRVVEALAGSRLHKQNFRRLVLGQGLVEATGKMDARSRGRPAELYRFRRDVLRERPAPGVGFSGAKWRADS